MASLLRAWLRAFGTSIVVVSPARGLGLLADDRSTSVAAPGCCNQTFVPESSFAPFHVPGQDSTIDVTPDGLGLDGSASGRASGFHDSDIFHGGESVFSIGFRIDGEGTFEMDGCFDSSHDASPGSASVELLAGDQPIFSQAENIFEPCQADPFDFTSDLTPGAYTLEAVAQCFGTDCGTSFQLTFQARDTAVPIPEPTTLALLAAGLVELAARAPRIARLTSARCGGTSSLGSGA